MVGYIIRTDVHVRTPIFYIDMHYILYNYTIYLSHTHLPMNQKMYRSLQI